MDNRRVLIPLPDVAARTALVRHLLRNQKTSVTDGELCRFIEGHTEGYSGSDLTALCKDAAMAPLRELGPHIAGVQEAEVPSH